MTQRQSGLSMSSSCFTSCRGQCRRYLFRTNMAQLHTYFAHMLHIYCTEQVVRSQADGVLTDEVVEQLLDTTYAFFGSRPSSPANAWNNSNGCVKSLDSLRAVIFCCGCGRLAVACVDRAMEEEKLAVTQLHRRHTQRIDTHARARAHTHGVAGACQIFQMGTHQSFR